MAKIVFGGGISHTPLLAIRTEDWAERANADIRNPALNLSDGRFVDYPTLSAEVGDRYADVATFPTFQEHAAKCQEWLDRFAQDLRAANPDIVVIVGDDQEELFGPENLPALSIFYGGDIVMHAEPNMETAARWVQDMRRGYAQDEHHVFKGHRAFALELIHALIDQEIDVASAASVARPKEAGFGHAFGFVARRVMADLDAAIVPILLNTYYPPNVIGPARCLTVGRALRRAIENAANGSRVAVVASGGLSHFVVDDALDRHVLEKFMSNDASDLARLPRGALNSGSSEILNWVLAAGAIEALPSRWSEYLPIYRTAAGTGVGVAVAARW